MEQPRWEKINNIVDAALELDSENRREFISKNCRGDPGLRKEVEEFIQSIEQSDSQKFLESPSSSFPGLTASISTENSERSHSLIGKTIDCYKILRLVEHGGMGSVFAAQRTDNAYEIVVALKVLRQGLDTPSNIARFEQERNILAKLEHPNITRLMDGGVTSEGLPYLIMDYVDGTPLYEFCDANELGIEERLKLFKTVCKAVRHAHQNAVIHRDLKPSNVLITTEGQVKVLDFGIAKLLEKNERNDSRFQTRQDARILTLRYAAPEQISREPVTTATDTYALGTLLYELLTGMHPFDLAEKKFSEREKIILEKVPPNPSGKFKNLSYSKRTEIAQNRNSNPSALRKKLDGELDAIVAKALRKDPIYRYNSVEQILEDLNRRENNLPVSAKKDTIRYRTSVFVKRRKTEIGIAAGILLLIIGFAAFHTHRITEERDRAQLEASRADEVSSFLLQLFDTESSGDTLSAAGLLEQGMEHLQGLENQPAHTDMLSVMGQAYMNFGDYDKAEELLLKTLTETRQMHGEESMEYATALYRKGLLHESRYEWEDAEFYFRKSYNLQSEILGEYHSKTASTFSRLSLSLRNTGQLEEAEQYARKAVDIHEEMFEPNHTERIISLANLAYVLRERGKTEEAESIYLQVIDRAENNPQVEKKVLATFYNNLGYLYREKDEYDKAAKSYRNALAYEKESYAEGHPDIVNTRKNLATTLYFQDSLREAELYFKENAAAIRKKYSTGHWRTASAINSLGLFYLENQRYEDAESYLRESTQINREVLGTDHLWTAYTEGLLAACLKFQEKEIALADSLDKHHVDLYRKHQDSFDVNHKNQLNRLARIYEKHDSSDSTYLEYQELLK